MLLNILALSSFLIVLLLLRQLVNILPSLFACLIRWKESVNMETSVKLSRDRNYLALAMVIPFCLVTFRYRLYAPDFLKGFGEDALLWLYIAIFAAYVLLRVLMIWLIRPDKMPKKTYVAANMSAFSFFIIYTLLLLATGAVMGLFDLPDETVRVAMLWISVLIYTVFLLRKTQIFSSSCSVFIGFLYLCALELIPTGILVVSGVVL